ncbi:MAG: hypothetical protein JRI68_22850 [Deltaproteobacteria bacterium]|nr:hypothetical protein [Deltaproteobacteria bacterium]
MKRVIFVLASGLLVLCSCSSDETSTGPGQGAAGGASSSGGGSGGSSSGTGGTGASGGGGSSSGTAGGGGSSSGSGGSGGNGGAGPLYLVSIDHAASPSTLLKIDVATGSSQVACSLPSGVDAVNYHSSTFNRDGTLYGSNYQSGSLDIIDPCSCAVTPLGQTGYGTIPGITADYAVGLYGIEVTNDLLLALDPNTAAGSQVGPLGVDFGTSGATWSDQLDGGNGGLYGINGPSNQLFTIHRTTGAASPLVFITGLTFSSVGIELHPGDGVIYACTDDARLYTINPGNGAATAIGNGMGHVAVCNNLAAPWKPVPCLESM